MENIEKRKWMRIGFLGNWEIQRFTKKKKSCLGASRGKLLGHCTGERGSSGASYLDIRAQMGR